MVLAMAVLSLSAMAQTESGYGLAGAGGVDVLGTGIFETQGSAVKFPEAQDTNIDILDVGNDRAMAFGNIFQRYPAATASNNLEIKKNQNSGNCSPCDGFCTDSCTKVNIEQIKVGNREAMAFGFASANNYVKIVTNQQ